MTYRDELEAAHHRIALLERELADMKAERDAWKDLSEQSRTAVAAVALLTSDSPEGHAARGMISALGIVTRRLKDDT